jgi:transposase
LHRSGELTPIVVPEPKDEAIRDLVRTREDAMHDRQRARLRLRSFLLRHGHAYTGRRWGPAHQLFLLKIKFEDPAQHIAFTEYRLAVHFRTECVERLEGALRKEVKSWRSLPVINALMTLRAIDFLSAITIVAELGDLRRFPHPRELMGYLGLVPSEHSSGPTQHRGGLTKTGNTHVRRIFIEAAWNYRFAARVGESLQPRHEGQPQHIVAIARELCGFIWDIGRQVPVSGTG